MIKNTYAQKRNSLMFCLDERVHIAWSTRISSYWTEGIMESVLLREIFFRKSWNMRCFTWNLPFPPLPKKNKLLWSRRLESQENESSSLPIYRIEKDSLLPGLVQDISNGMKHSKFLESNTFFWYKILLTFTKLLIISFPCGKITSPYQFCLRL